MKRIIALSLAGCISLFGTSLRADKRQHTWTTSADFEMNALIFEHVTVADQPDLLRQALGRIETPYLWIANTEDSTVAQMDTTTGEVIRLVDFGIDGLGPSRTAVDLDHNCWVGFETGDAVGRLDADDPGLDLYLPNSHYTAQGIAAVHGLPRAVTVNSEGNVWVGNWTDTIMRLLEPVTGYVLNPQTLELWDSATDPMAAIRQPIVGGGNAYDTAMDEYGNLWISQKDTRVGQYNATNGSHIMTYTFPFSTDLEGITVDTTGNVWLGNGSAGGVVYLPRKEIERCQDLEGTLCHASGAGRILQAPGWPWPDAVTPGICPSNSRTRGIVADRLGQIWVACYGISTNDCNSNSAPPNTGVMKIQLADAGEPLSDYEFVAVYGVGGGPNGVTTTADGDVWIVNRCGGGPAYVDHPCPTPMVDGGTVTRYRGDGTLVATYPTCGSRPAPYTDMTGYHLLSMTHRNGRWRQIYDSEIPGLNWASLDWNVALPAGTSIEFTLGASDDLADLDADLPIAVSATDGPGGDSIEGIVGQYIAVEAALSTASDLASAVIHDVTVSSVCVPEDELCDTIDNDCDPSTADGSSEPWFSTACDGDDLDLCDEGTYDCVDGLQTCSDITADNPEQCNNLDDDCDPSTADGSSELWLGAACDGDDLDLCEEGTYDCVDGLQTCSDITADNPEQCNSLDDDCDGETDEGDVCGPTENEEPKDPSGCSCHAATGTVTPIHGLLFMLFFGAIRAQRHRSREMDSHQKS